ncbi:hypothetical protein K443DRAFT_74193, partial [Laccaria amethystina LaAM-08-1]
IYGSDEVGIQAQGGGKHKYVFGGRKKAAPYQQRAGTRDNITVIVTICADGTSTPPATIFKGSAYQVKWGENNPLNALIGYQQKGWTDGEIGAAWMKIFEEQAQEKANREYRLLVIDGHNLHYTVALLLLVRLHQIIVICYPAHGTHIYQGLDVVIFVILKLLLSKERNKLLQDTGKAINKSNFLSVITNTYRQALTPGNIKTAFRKTGIHPFNPDVVTPDMLAPSKETSLEANLPV